MRIRHILLIAAAAGLFLSCVKEPEQPNGGPGDGTATRITLSLTSDKQAGALPQAAPKDALQAWNASGGLGTAGLGAIPGTRALTPEQEQSISNLHILVFDALGALVTNEHFDNLDIKDAGSVSLETLPGEKMQLWAVANGDVNDDTGDTPLDTELRAITTLDELKALLVTVKGNGLNRADRLTMVGCETVTITKPHVGSIPIQLHFLSAKVTISIKSNVPEGQAITIDNWDMVNIPKKTYLMERANPNEDAVTAASDYMTTNAKYQFDPQDELTKTWSQAIYLFENRRGKRVERADPSPDDMYPDMGFGDQDQRGKAYYAPTGATYMLVYGTYTKDGRMNNVIYKIFLGENEIDNYDIYRGKHYTYNVTINGLNDINIDTNVEWGSASFSVATSQDFQLDAHPDFRVLRIGGTAVDGTTPAYAAVEVQEANGSPCEWLTLSPLNLYRHGIKQATGEHQQFAVGEGVGSYVRSKYIHTPTTESTFAEATFGMTRKLTKIPFDQPAIYTFQNVLVYADAYEGTADRSAKVHVTYYKGAEGTDPVGELTYDITQSGAIKVSDSLYIERYEESAMLLHPGLASGFQNTTTMQWGYNTATLYAADDRFTNGNYLTANAVYNNVNARDGMTAPVWTAAAYTDYREKYPREGTQVVEPSTLPVSDNVYFYPEQTQATALTAYFHPIFNSSAARYCHEKNRDTDGDGIISAEETVWYLPSFADMWYIGMNMPEGVNLTGNYWTASEESNTNSWTYAFPAAPTSTIKSTFARVRCVRGIGAVLPGATMESTEDDKTKINLLATAKSSGEFNITDNTGLTWTARIRSKSTWLKISPTANGTEIKDSVSGIGYATFYAISNSANPSSSDTRSEILTFSRSGMANIELNVSQNKSEYKEPHPHSGWAGCNVYWDITYQNEDGQKGRLTFTDVGDKTKENYQGVYFKWGSLVAVESAPRVYNNETSVLYSPNGQKDYSWSAIPYISEEMTEYKENQYHLGVCHNPAKNVGDICKYISDRGWAPGTGEGNAWRMPTAFELRCLPERTALTKRTSGEMESYGTFNGLLSFKWNNMTWPYAGYRETGSGIQRDEDKYVDMWTATALTGTTAHMAYAYDILTQIRTEKSPRATGMVIRCVRE